MRGWRGSSSGLLDRIAQVLVPANVNQTSKRKKQPHKWCNVYERKNFQILQIVMKRNNFKFLLIPLILMGCHKGPKLSVDKDKADSVISNPKTKADTLTPVTDAVRGQATRILKPSFFHSPTFVLLGDSITGIETTQLENGDKLILTNCGWEYYTLGFRFETTRFEKDTTDIHFWCIKAIEMMQSIEPGLDAPIDIKLGTKKFLEFLDGDAKNNYSNVSLGKEIDYGGDDIREFVWLNRIEKIDDKRIAIEINYSMGPL